MKYIIKITLLLLIFSCTSTGNVKFSQVCDDEFLNHKFNNGQKGEIFNLENRIYYLCKPIRIAANDIKIIGKSDTKIISKNMDQPVMYIYESDHITIENLFMKHIEPPQDSKHRCSGAVIAIFSSENIFINKNKLNGSGIYGVAVYSGNYIKITDNEIFNNSKAAINLPLYETYDKDGFTYETNEIYIENNNIHDNPKFFDTKRSDKELSELLIIRGNSIR